MKRLFAITAITLSIAFAGTTGCVKGDDITDPIDNNVTKIIPDISNFVLTAARTFIAGEAALIQIASTTLLDGTYTVNYSMTGANTFSGTATMNVSGGHGSFNTPVLTNKGNTNVIINSLMSASGGIANLTSNNTSSFFDSTGNMSATFQLSSPFYATDVLGFLNGNTLTIDGVMWDPVLRSMHITVYDFTVVGLPKTINFHDLVEGVIQINSETSLKHAVHGAITIQGIQNSVISGSYSGILQDSSSFNGTFQAKFN